MSDTWIRGGRHDGGSRGVRGCVRHTDAVLFPPIRGARCFQRAEVVPARRRLASTSAVSLFSATSAEAIGLSANVAKPQSGVNRRRSAPNSLDCRFRAAHDLVDGFHPVQFLIHRSDADAPIRGQIPQHVQLACPRRTEFQEVITDLQLAQQRQQRPIVAGQGHGFVAAPISPADVNRRALARSAGHDLVQ